MQRNNRGFTIIEVLIVLAVASVIMIIIFMAVPAMKRVQRDTRRRQDLGKFFAAVQEYQVNNNIKSSPFVEYPADKPKFEDFKSKFLGPEFSQYNITLVDLGNSHSIPYEEDKIVFFPKHFCATTTSDTEEVTQSTGIHPPFAWAVLVSLEGTQDYICIDQGNMDL